jgi:hypothetical protein
MSWTEYSWFESTYHPASLDSFADSMRGVCLQGFLSPVAWDAAGGELMSVTILSVVGEKNVYIP